MEKISQFDNGTCLHNLPETETFLKVVLTAVFSNPKLDSGPEKTWTCNNFAFLLLKKLQNKRKPKTMRKWGGGGEGRKEEEEENGPVRYSH